jgi:CrcB protein
MRPEAYAYLVVAAGSALGGAARFWLSGLVARGFGETFPWGTLAVNVLGSFLIGVVATVTGPDGRLLVSPAARQFWMLGIFGGFTTFSSFSLQTLSLAQEGEWVQAGGNVGLSVVLCLAGVWLGAALGSWVNR